jgi:AcrR family transcriptional regulator
MADQRPDRRTQRTRTALRRAFIDLLLEKGYASLTADEVAERADVARSTLYAHFGGLAGLIRVSLDTPSGPLAGLVDDSVSAEQLVGQLEHFREQRRRNGMFFEDPLRTIWVKRLAELIEPRLGPTTGLPSAFVALQIAEAQIALVRHWLAARPSPSAQSVANAMVATTHALRTALTAAP